MTIRILIVDDAPFVRTNLSRIIKERGWEVVGEAGTGQEAVDQYVELKPDVVTMDITMPDMDGIEATRQILERDPAARILMCSAQGQMDKVVEAVRAGAKDFVMKPFHKDRVWAGIEGLIEP